MHLLNSQRYNSVFFQSSYSAEQLMAATTPEFVNLTSPGWWNRTHAQDTRDDGPIAVEQLSLLQENLDRLTLLNNDDCQAAFNSSNLQPKYLNVLLVTKLDLSTSTIMDRGFDHTVRIGRYQSLSKVSKRGSYCGDTYPHPRYHVKACQYPERTSPPGYSTALRRRQIHRIFVQSA